MNHPANPSPPDPLSGGRSAFSGANPRPFVVWLTGVSGAGKSTLASLLKLQLDALGHRTYLLDGDTLREGLNRDLGFSDADRRENIRRTAEVARLMTDAGFIVIAALISPFADARAQARARFAPGTFVEVFVDVALEVAEARDPKGAVRVGVTRNHPAIHRHRLAVRATGVARSTREDGGGEPRRLHGRDHAAIAVVGRARTASIDSPPLRRARATHRLRLAPQPGRPVIHGSGYTSIPSSSAAFASCAQAMHATHKKAGQLPSSCPAFYFNRQKPRLLSARPSSACCPTAARARASTAHRAQPARRQRRSPPARSRSGTAG